MNILVIGGSGFIGTCLVSRLIKSGHDVGILDIKTSRTFPHLTIQADIRDLDGLINGMQNFQGGKIHVLVNLAAEHRDDIRPLSLYDEVNVEGSRNVCRACNKLGVRHLIFTSSVAVYGFAPVGTGEDGSIRPFNDYGRTKAQAEGVYRNWLAEDQSRILTIVRPTVVFGEKNRGNVYNLLRQMAIGPFVMVGQGRNLKSVAYVENVAAFLEYSLSAPPGLHLHNYVDKPDYSMNDLVRRIDMIQRGHPRRMLRIPYVVGLVGAMVLDGLARLTRRTFPISAIRVKKFCADTMFSTNIGESTGFVPPVPLEAAWERTVRYEFQDVHDDEELFFTE